MKSESINELASALSKAQASIEGASKDATNPHFRSKYSDLAACWSACRKPLSDNGLAVIQIPSAEGNNVTITTVMTHSSGQFIEGSLTVQNQNQKNAAQGVGSCITYLRRYALCSFVGIAPEEDDGQAAASSGPKTPSYQKPPQIYQGFNKGPSDQQRKRMFALLNASSWTPDRLKEVIKEQYGIESTTELSPEQYTKVCEALEKNPKPKEAQSVEALKASGQIKTGSEV